MAKVIKVSNPPIPSEEETFLTTRYASGTTLTTKNNEGWGNNDVAIVGNPGEEKTEAGLVTGTSGNTDITIQSALKFDHPNTTPMYKCRYDYISLERKPSGGAYAVIAEGIQLIEWDERDGFTKIYVSAGADSDTYKWRFYNSRSGEYSDYSGELPGSGLTSEYAGYIIASIRREGKIPGYAGVNNAVILGWLNDGQTIIDGKHDRWWFTLTEDDSSSRIQSVAGTYKYNLPSGFRGMDVLKVLDTNSKLYNLSFIPLVEYDSYIQDQSTGARNDATERWSLLPPDSSNSVGYFGVHPIPNSTNNYFYRRYWKFLPTLTSFASRTLIPVPEALFNYGMYRLESWRGNSDKAAEYLSKFNQNVEVMIAFQRRQIGQPELQRYRGSRGFSRLFGENAAYSDAERENYW